ncbi:MAG TPA: CoA ester lyase [Pseudonocardia sp.]|uniref:HpcH/HpaI aldolase/citrate lyase family protein n=1 Tax=Pseudonocardia sp. TaxID=60912 RepID=UPI002B4B2961|nr:CoA ester lyase [Pseudonocardia sp.]HLU55668.1 CoA ester lyase [Pseudonocardia sp.]
MTGPETTTARSWLYVPGHRGDRVQKALRAGADAVVVDLEDAVPPDRKADARAGVAAAVAAAAEAGGPPVWVRVNDPAGPWGEADLDAVTGSGVAGLRLPRAADPAVVREVADRTRLPLQLLIETAAGLARAVELASAHPLVAGLGLGEADLVADLRLTSDAGLDWARGHVVVAARAAGLPSPVQSVYTDVADLDGLRASSERGRATGFLGRSVVHPRQVPVVNDVFTPSAEEIRRAAAVVRTAERARSRGEVAVLDEDGRFVDPAVVERARVVLGLAASVPRGGDR